MPRRIDQRPDDAAHGFDLARRPAGLGEDRADGVLGRLGARGRVEIALRVELVVELADQSFELAMRRGGSSSFAGGWASALRLDHS